MFEDYDRIEYLKWISKGYWFIWGKHGSTSLLQAQGGMYENEFMVYSY